MFELFVLFPVDVCFDFPIILVFFLFLCYFPLQNCLLFPEQQLNINEAVALVLVETLNLGSHKWQTGRRAPCHGTIVLLLIFNYIKALET